MTTFTVPGPPVPWAPLHFGVEAYDHGARRWLKRSGHYLNNPPAGCLFAVVVRAAVTGLGVVVGGPHRLGMCLIGRPVARALPQDGSVGEITRMVLADGLPHGTASAVLRFAADVAVRRGMRTLIAYHDRTRHTGCIYKKAGFRRDGVTRSSGMGWSSRVGRTSAALLHTPKRRWRLDLVQTDCAYKAKP